MAGVFDIDLDQPEENVSDDEIEEVLLRKMSQQRNSFDTRAIAS